MGLKEYLMKCVPFAAMAMVECMDVGLTTLGKAAISKGMNYHIFIVYSNALASLILLPSLFFLNRAHSPPLSFSILCKFFLLSLIGITTMQNCAMTGISYSSPTLGSAMNNLIPAFTFVLAAIFRIEKIDIRSSKSQIRMLGTVVSISGALIVTLYKGASIGGSPFHENVSQPFLMAQTDNWVIGGLFLATAYISLALWNIAQAVVLRGYPSQLTIVAFSSLFGAIQSTILSLIVVKDPNAWIISPDIELISIVYGGICGYVVSYLVMTWCIDKKGPIFVAMFKPLKIGIAAFMGAAFLGDTLHIGSVIGSIVIVIGFYTVLWAQSKEQNDNSQKVYTQPSSPSRRSPLLESHIRDEANVLA
ncbi:WAT1-related protein [Senna tora]|uniref:WAT1-related protein n=1 Tax=Senna tora TaxID=362788 RepID=A0A834SKN1_9FABA|nr:WAT1-related protein [Senna tora]